MKNKLYIIDGSSFAYRAFYAIGHLSNSKGQPTNAVYGFIKMIRKIIENYKPSYLAVVFDKGKETFRHKQYENYKAHRKPMPDELVSQIPWIKKVVQAYNFPLLESIDYEADDIIATLAQDAEKKDFEISILTSDKDILQLINDNIKVIVPSKGDFVYDKNTVKERYGVEPEKIRDLLALTGDNADNIPGIPGVGEKTAAKLLKNYMNIDVMFDSLGNMPDSKLKNSIVCSIDQVKCNLELVTLRKDVPLEITPEKCKIEKPATETLKNIFMELEFKGFLNEILGAYNEKIDKKEKTQTIENLALWEQVYEEIKNVRKICVLYEDNILQMAYEKNGVIKSMQTDKIDLIKESFSKLMEDNNIAKYSYDLKSVLGIFNDKCICIRGPFFDISIAEFLLNLSGDKIRISQDNSEVRDLAAVYYNIVPLLEKKMIDQHLYELFLRIEMPLIEVLSDMEKTGIKIDKDVLKKLSKEFDAELSFLKREIYKLAGEEFNINSPKQLEYVLFEKCNLPKGKRTKTGYSTDVDVLNALEKHHELPGYILKYRQINKLKGTYIDPLPDMVNPATGRLHTTFNQSTAATGRLSSKDPNLQNIPIRSDYGAKIRTAFVPGYKDYIFMGADYSQIELRILAHLSGDKRLIVTFNEQKDIHTMTAQEIFDVSFDLVTDDMRRQAKVINFGILYGMGAKSLSKELNIPVKQAQHYIDAYFKKYPDVSSYIRDTLEEVSHNGYVVTMFGRKRVIPELSSGNPGIKAMGQRIAINTRIQGSAADVIKMAMINIYRKFKKNTYPVQLLLQVHDELIFEVNSDSVEQIEEIVRAEMENVVELKVPLKVNINRGISWADL